MGGSISRPPKIQPTYNSILTSYKNKDGTPKKINDGPSPKLGEKLFAMGLDKKQDGRFFQIQQQVQCYISQQNNPPDDMINNIESFDKNKAINLSEALFDPQYVTTTKQEFKLLCKCNNTFLSNVSMVNNKLMVTHYGCKDVKLYGTKNGKNKTKKVKSRRIRDINDANEVLALSHARWPGNKVNMNFNDTQNEMLHDGELKYVNNVIKYTFGAFILKYGGSNKAQAIEKTKKIKESNAEIEKSSAPPQQSIPIHMKRSNRKRTRDEFMEENKEVVIDEKTADIPLKKQKLAMTYRIIPFQKIGYINSICTGGFSSVHTVCYNNVLYAMKAADWKYDMSPLMFRREIDLVFELSNDRIAGIAKGFAVTKFDKYIFLISDLYIGSLYDIMAQCYLVKMERFYLSRKLCLDIVPALNYIHTKQIVHRDLKKENILFKYNNNEIQFALTDFGISHRLGNAMSLTESVAGTIPNFPINAFRRKIISPQVDSYGLGIVLFEIQHGHLSTDHTILPFHTTQNYDQIEEQFQIPLEQYYMEKNKYTAIDWLIAKLVILDSEQRYETKDILKCEVYVQFKFFSYSGKLSRFKSLNNCCVAVKTNKIEHYYQNPAPEQKLIVKRICKNVEYDTW